MGGGRFGRVLAAVSLAVVLGGVSLAAAGGQARSNEAPVEAQVAQQLARTGHASFWIVLHGNANVAPAASIHNRSRRGEFVYERLTSYARESQAPVRAWLDAHGVQYQAYWIVNAIFVKSAGPSIVDSLAARSDVKEIRANHCVPDPEGDARSVQRRSAVDHGVGAERDQCAAGLVDVQRPRRGHRRLEHRHRRPLHAPGARRQVPREPGRRQLRQQLQLVGSARTMPDLGSVRHGHSRHAHDGHDGRRRRRPRHEPDRRRTACEVDPRPRAAASTRR